MSEPVVAIATLPSKEAGSVANAIVTARHAACVSVLPAMNSVYWWEGELQQDPGQMLVIKTTRDLIGAVEKSIRENSDEEIFELLVLDVTGGNPAYLSWLDNEVATPAE